MTKANAGAAYRRRRIGALGLLPPWSVIAAHQSTHGQPSKRWVAAGVALGYARGGSNGQKVADCPICE